MCWNAWFVYLEFGALHIHGGVLFVARVLCLYSALVDFPYLDISLVRFIFPAEDGKIPFSLNLSSAGE
jgi:hypothetical protein